MRTPMNSCVYARNNMAEVKVDILLLTEKFVNDIAGCSVSNSFTYCSLKDPLPTFQLCMQ